MSVSETLGLYVGSGMELGGPQVREILNELDRNQDTIAQLRAERDSLVERLAKELMENGKLRQLLRRCEWGRSEGYYAACSVCRAVLGDGHKPDCALSAALKGETK